MAHRYVNRAWMTTATTGTGTVTLGSANSGEYYTFAEAGMSSGDTADYVILDGTDVEMGVGTYTSSGTTFSRDAVTSSRISGTAGTSKISLSGSATIFLTSSASEAQAVYDKLLSLAANSVLARADTSAGAVSGVALAASQLLGRGSTGNVAAIALGTGLSMSGTTLNATGGVTSVSIQTFTSSGTWTKPAGLLFAIVKQQAPGGGGGGGSNSGAGQSVAQSGAGGGYTEKLYMEADLSATETVTIGAASTGGAAGNNSGTAGGNSTFKSMTASGGALGAGAARSNLITTQETVGGDATGGDINIKGQTSAIGFYSSAAGLGWSTKGGNSVLGTAANSVISGNTAGNSGTGYGQGGRGGWCSTTSVAGAKGGDGITYIIEYCA